MLKYLNITDEFTRQAIAIEVERPISGDDIVTILEALINNELLDVEIFTTLLEAKNMAEDYRQDYNQHRPHSLLGYLTPHEFKQNWHHNKTELTTVLDMTPVFGPGLC